jgi:hypothetical protein
VPLFDLLSLIAAPAYAGLVACLALLATPGEIRSGGAAGWAAGALALAVFFFLPFGSLPPIVPLDAGLPAALLLLTLAAPLSGARPQGGFLRGFLARGPLPLAAAAALAAWIAHARGFPGAALNAATFTTLPLAAVMGSAGRAGLVCLAISLTSLAGAAFAPGAGTGFAWKVLRLAAAQIALALLLPATPSRLLFPDAPLAPAADALANALALVLLARIMPRAGRLLNRPALPAALLLAGLTLCVADTLTGG